MRRQKFMAGLSPTAAGTYFWQGISRSKPHLRHLKLSSNPVLEGRAKIAFRGQPNNVDIEGFRRPQAGSARGDPARQSWTGGASLFQLCAPLYPQVRVSNRRRAARHCDLGGKLSDFPRVGHFLSPTTSADKPQRVHHFEIERLFGLSEVRRERSDQRAPTRLHSSALRTQHDLRPAFRVC